MLSNYWLTRINMVTEALNLAEVLCTFGFRSICVVIATWVQLVFATIFFHFNVIWRILMWAVALISLPARVLNALQREKLLEMHLYEMQVELENLLWDRKELEERIQRSIKEHSMMDLLVSELEEEHDKAISKIELLEGELQNLKKENMRLKEEVLQEGSQSTKADDGTSNGDKNVTTNVRVQLRIPSLKSSNDEKCISVLHQQRRIAIVRCLFSLILSLAVGFIIWEAKDPCTPLVVSLIIVEGMSLKSVLRFFSSIKNKPAVDAVILLSINWFLLGTLASPSLPRAAQLVARLLGGRVS